jgi:hypothetical protein
LIVPLVVGAGAGGECNTGLLPLSMTALGFFLFRYPLMLAIKSRAPNARQGALRWSAIYAALTAISGTWLMFATQLLPLVAIGILGLVSLAIYLWLAARRAEMSTLGEWTGIAGLALGAPSAYLVATRALDSTAIAVYLLDLLFFGGTILYVRFKVREQPRTAEPTTDWLAKLWTGRATILYHAMALIAAVMLAAIGVVPALAAAAFILPTCKVISGVVSRPVRLDIPRLGFIELIMTTLFAVVVLAAYR